MSHSPLAAHRCPSPPVAAGARRFTVKRAGATLSHVYAEGAFTGYASLFGLADQAGDVVMPGAFRDSLTERGPAGIRMLWQHDPATPLGVWDEVVEDGRGLKVAGRLDLAVGKARELLALMRSGAVDGLSIGFRTERARKDPASGLRRLYRIDLWEISLVTFPMLPQARISSVKSCLPQPDVADSDRLIRAIRRAEAALRA
jgi:HK97 family phage prohead protease